MESLIFIAIFNVLLLLVAFKTKIGLYTVTPENQWQDAVNLFEENKKAIDDLDLSDYKLGSGHIYE
ncbi:hypothetical protein [Mariniflexile sp. AS56]|uniref:hypothetical protein n=1 Tax=Mariniflexile sp. AS56 TaxID=3063957 RepID=UPI0026EED367|nr:hypothetical protein [Mariniflexile sp. AS56]MDO7171304.1 hypothetical protein [Mariniflexile sp. AS56]